MGPLDATTRQRAVTPVVGAVLLFAIVVGVSAITGALVLGLADSGDPAPVATFQVQPTDGSAVRLVHTDGDVVDGDRLRLRGVQSADSDAFADREVGAGTAATVAPVDDEITVVYRADDARDSSYVLETLTVPGGVPFASYGAVELLAERDEQPAGVDGRHGLLFAVENPTDEPAIVTGITLEVVGEGDVGHVRNDGDTRPDQCGGVDDPTRFCSLVQLSKPARGTVGYVDADAAGDLPYTVGSVPGEATDEAAWVAPTLAPDETARLEVYRFHTDGSDPAAVADMRGETVRVTVAFDSGGTLVVERTLGDGDLEPEPASIAAGDVAGSGVTVDGDLEAVAGSVDLDGASAVAGDVYAGGDVDLADDAAVEGGIVADADGDVQLTGTASVGGAVATGGSVDVDTAAAFTMDGVAAGADVDLDTTDLVVGDDVTSTGGEVELDGNQTRVEGSIEAPNSDVEIEGNRTTITGDVLAAGSEDDVDIDGDGVTVEGDVTVTGGDLDVDGDDMTIGGDVEAAGSTVSLDGDGVTVEGDVDAATIECGGSDVTIAGQDCADYAS